MAIDFPASPTVGQTYTFGGLIYVFTAQGVWTSSGPAFAPLVSPIFTGDPRAPTPPTTDNDTSIATTAYVQSSLPKGTWGVKDLRSPGGGTANVYNFSFDEATLRDVNGNTVLIKNGSFNIANNAGFGAGGIDVALVTGDVHFYAIWGSVPGVAGIASNAVPQNGPILPSGYTHWCYLTTLKFTAGVGWATTRVVGNKVFYYPYSSYAIFTGGNSGDGGWVNAGYSQFVPVIATAWQLFGSCSASGNAAAGMFFYWGLQAVGTQILQAGLAFDAGGNTIATICGWMPNAPGQIMGYGWALWFNISGLTGSSQNGYVNGYEVPNGS
jgi:hypothetical protein